MTTGEMFKGSLMLKVLLIFINFTVFSFGKPVLFMVLGILALIMGCFMALRQGAAIGHEACSVSSTLERIAQTPEKAGQYDPRMFKRGFDKQRGIKALFAGALVDYAINAVYIIFMLLKIEEIPLYASRLLSFLVSIPYWPLVCHWHEVFDVITWDIVAILMVCPFVLPAFQYIGYLQGPKLWEKTEKAMADGKRRAKARSRINRRKKAPKARGPEI